MRTFRCDNCGHALFFENVQCLQCGSVLAFLPDRLSLSAIESVPLSSPIGLWRRKRPEHGFPEQQLYRHCQNRTAQRSCNFAVAADDPNGLCVSCRQTRVLPDLSYPVNVQRWYQIEAAKRRLFYTLAKLGLVCSDHVDGMAHGPAFEFLADLPGLDVVTGHFEGVITLNVAEADDEERVRRRVALREPYRTLLGHLRHESGHFYWDRLIRDGGQTQAYRQVFGNESADYEAALTAHYGSGGSPANWQAKHVSAYATAHPWEDWAETWAHYLHMVDLLETAASYSTRLSVLGSDNAAADAVDDPFDNRAGGFDRLVAQWVPVTLLLNSLNRSLGQDDAYPFALTAGALNKLRYVHDVIQAAAPARDAGTSCWTDSRIDS